MTIDTADALMKGGQPDDFIDSYKKCGRRYPDAVYGIRFGRWIFSDDREPYNSWGNGSAMRVSPCAWLNLEAILLLSGTESYFVGDPQKSWKLTFEPDTSLQSGIDEVVSLLPGWQLRENTDGTVGIAPITDSRFEQPSVYVFERDKTCFNYDVEYSDENTCAKLCVSCKEPAATLYITLPPHRWWVSPQHKTMYVAVPNGTGSAELAAYADELAKLIAISGRIESFAGIFTPQLIIGDEIELVETNGRRSKTGTVTSVRHKFGKGGFITEFTVDSSGRKGKALLKDYVSQIGGKSTQSNVVIS